MKSRVSEIPRIFFLLIAVAIGGAWFFAIYETRTVSLANETMIKDMHFRYVEFKDRIQKLVNTVISQSDMIEDLQTQISNYKSELNDLNSRLDSRDQDLFLLSQQFEDNEPNEDVYRKLNQLQKMYGTLFCTNNEVTPTGGFCISKDKPNIGGNQKWDINLTRALETHLFKGKSVGDFGGGLGHYTKQFRKDNLVASVECFDGAYNVEEVTEGVCQFADLTESQPHLPIYDWILSLEVAEHIPPALMMSFLKNLDEHNKEGIALSWAVPYQSGLAHVNEQPNDYVINQFSELGYVLDGTMTTLLRNSVGPECPWFKGSLMIFRKNKP